MSPQKPLPAKKTNRRLSFRINEEANLFYHKLETAPAPADLISTQAAASSMAPNPLMHEQQLPASQSLENDTLHVNISNSGIAFTCQEALNAGDFLRLRILLLSSMTVLQTSCKVVYCKPSNPYENNRYPYTIGAYFINLTPDDKRLLNAHINQTRKRHLIVYSLLSLILIAALAMPAETLHLLLTIGHHLIELFLHATHILIEYIELYLDHLIEHSLHTTQRNTQIIVFYIMLAFGLLVAFIGWLIVPRVLSQWFKRLKRFFSRKKSSFVYYWQHTHLRDKAKLVGFSSLALFSYFYFLL